MCILTATKFECGCKVFQEVPKYCEQYLKAYPNPKPWYPIVTSYSIIKKYGERDFYDTNHTHYLTLSDPGNPPFDCNDKEVKDDPFMGISCPFHYMIRIVWDQEKDAEAAEASRKKTESDERWERSGPRKLQKAWERIFPSKKDFRYPKGHKFEGMAHTTEWYSDSAFKK